MKRIIIIIVVVYIVLNLPIRISGSKLTFTPVNWLKNKWYKRRHTLLNIPLDTAVCAENLQIFAQVLNEFNITFWISEGTALGAVRDGWFISHDDDVDIGMWYEDWERFVTLAIPTLRKRGFSIDGYGANPFELSRNGEKIDVDFVAKGKPCVACRTKHASCTSCDPLLPYLKNMSTIEFNNGTFLCPGIDYLEYLYGPTWSTPQRKRK